MGKKLGIVLSAVGIALLVWGIRMDTESNMQIVALSGGFIAAVIGMGAIFVQGPGMEAKGEYQGASDTPTRIRIVGILVTLASLALPYIRVPLDAAPEGTSYSFIGLINALRLGTQVEGSFTLLIFMSVVVAGAFASLLHHVGGYIVIFGTVGYGYIIRELTGGEPIQILLNEFQIGLYVAILGASIIIGSSFVDYEVETRDRSWYGGGR